MSTIQVAGTELNFGSFPYPEDCGEKPYEPEVVSVLQRFIEPGDLVVDVGASVGYHTCIMAHLVGPEGIVLAIEPHEKSFEHLVAHVRENKFGNVGCLRLGLWHKDCPELPLWSIDHLGYSSPHRMYLEAIETDRTEGRALDTLLIRDHPRLIKIDVEGAEPEVLWGAQRILGRGVDAVIVEINYEILRIMGRTDRPLREFMKELGYDMYIVNIAGDGQFNLGAPYLVPLQKTIDLKNIWHMNVLFSTEREVNRRWSKISVS